MLCAGERWGPPHRVAGHEVALAVGGSPASGCVLAGHCGADRIVIAGRAPWVPVAGLGRLDRDGEGALASLDGEFGLAWVDPDRRRLVVYRSVSWPQTIYLRVSSTRVTWSTRLSDLARPGDRFGAQVSDETLAVLACDADLPPGHAWLSGVRRLRPGHTFVVDWVLLGEQEETRRRHIHRPRVGPVGATEDSVGHEAGDHEQFHGPGRHRGHPSGSSMATQSSRERASLAIRARASASVGRPPAPSMACLSCGQRW